MVSPRRLAVIADSRWPAGPPIHLLDRVLVGENAIDGRLEATRDFGLDHFGGTPVATKEALGGGLTLESDDVAKRHIGALSGGAAGVERMRSSIHCPRFGSLRSISIGLVP